jgi:DNA-directed RNA polymerase specialized sigma subunit
MSENRQQDAVLWEKWHRSQSPQDLQALLNHLQPLINQQVNRWAGGLSRDVLEMQAKVLAAEAIKTYNPAMGAALGTHVTNRLQKLSRVVYTHTNALRLPEHKTISMASFAVAQDALRSNLGREPTHIELGDHLGWTTQRVSEFQKAYDRKELLTSGEFNPAQFTVADENDPMVGFVFHDMGPQHQQVFEHLTGYGGKEVLSNPALMKKFNLTQGQLSYMKRQITDKFHSAMKTSK